MNAAAMIAAGLFLTPAPSRADEVADAKNALEKGDNKAARTAYRKLADESPLGDRRDTGRFRQR